MSPAVVAVARDACLRSEVIESAIERAFNTLARKGRVSLARIRQSLHYIYGPVYNQELTALLERGSYSLEGGYLRRRTSRCIA